MTVANRDIMTVTDRAELGVNEPFDIVVAELMDQPEKKRRLVHLVNYAGPQGKTVSNLRVAVELPQGNRPGPVTLLTPDGGESHAVAGRFEQGRVLFTVPHLDTYTLAVIELA